MCNPPFNEEMVDKFTRKLERTMVLYPRTRVMLILPYRPKERLFKKFMARNRWRLRCFVPQGHPLFMHPKADDPFSQEKAKSQGTISNIVCLESCADRNAGNKFTLEQQLYNAHTYYCETLHEPRHPEDENEAASNPLRAAQMQKLEQKKAGLEQQRAVLVRRMQAQREEDLRQKRMAAKKQYRPTAARTAMPLPSQPPAQISGPSEAANNY
ncbi:MAG: hypothetical protein VX239_04110 [Candidatus Thermoplasmatota archaeon]|nr:hypothetical protein [Candidatus Thermoplasmatota archaeon]